MAQALSLGVPARVSVDTTVNRLTRTAFERWRTLTILEKVSGSTASIYLDVVGTADGGAAPTTDRILVEVSKLPAEVDISPYGTVGLAADAAGVLGVVVR